MNRAFRILRPRYATGCGAKHGVLLGAALLAARGTLASPVAAQDISGNSTGTSTALEPSSAAIFRRHRAAADNALELRLSAGYQQGVGSLGAAPASHVQDVAGVGMGGELGVGFRISPRFLVGAYGSGASYRGIGEGSSARSFSLGGEGQLHFRPFRTIDPWLSAGIGYRVLAFDLAGEGTSVHKAIQLPRLAVGVDYRPSPFVGIGPFVAVDLALFSGEPRDATAAGGTRTTLGSFVSVGISARFDLLGRREKYASESADRDSLSGRRP